MFDSHLNPINLKTLFTFIYTFILLPFLACLVYCCTLSKAQKYMDWRHSDQILDELCIGVIKISEDEKIVKSQKYKSIIDRLGFKGATSRYIPCTTSQNSNSCLVMHANDLN